MIGYVTLGSNDLQRAAAFYDTLLAGIGASRLWEMDRGICWGTHPERPQLAIMQPFNGEPATVGNGVMVGFYLDSRTGVDQLHAHALQLGSQDEGAPGLRGDDFYGAYFRDPDGNKLCCFTMAK
ncbi:glyoxalase [Aquitalea sp. FJL05]|uniref:VOC family protein n=1 Tax=Aquitalea TaxID=407217 RepID=UPI000F5B3898|nr:MULTISPECIES: VOC family protein [Aquitalea]RQO78429.1 glyoxalase [Aquitalea sp. FJL05]